MKYKTQLIGLMTVCMTAAAPAATIALVDFGMNGATPSGHPDQQTTGSPTYNNLALPSVTVAASQALTTILIADNGGTADVSSYGLLSTTGVATGWTISFQSKGGITGGGIGTAGVGGLYDGMVASDAAFFAANAKKDSVFINNSAALRVTITGLTDGFSYNLIAFTGRNQTTNVNSSGIWSLVTGAATTSQFQNAAGTYTANTGAGVNSSGTNLGYAVGWNGVTSAGGTIAFDITSNQTLLGFNVTDFNALSISVPEPSAALLGGLGVLALLRRRRN